MINCFAPAKLNLALHVVGQREDGYHLLDSLVCLVECGDEISVSKSEGFSFTVSGPFANQVPCDPSNLVIKAAALLGVEGGVAIHLVKNLPPASGIGGGSSDAAAVIRALTRLLDLPMPTISELTALGADVPVCMSPDLTRMQGIGEDLDLLGPPPDFGLILVNPRVEVSTPAVFKALPSKTNSGMSQMPASDRDQWVDWIGQQRNDLEQPAISLAPIIQDALAALANTSQARVVRMSGSGATCFALYPTREIAVTEAAKLSQQHPEWWVQATGPCYHTFI